MSLLGHMAFFFFCFLSITCTHACMHACMHASVMRWNCSEQKRPAVYFRITLHHIMQRFAFLHPARKLPCPGPPTCTGRDRRRHASTTPPARQPSGAGACAAAGPTTGPGRAAPRPRAARRPRPRSAACPAAAPHAAPGTRLRPKNTYNIFGGSRSYMSHLSSCPVGHMAGECAGRCCK